MSSRDQPNLLAMLDAIGQIETYTDALGDADELYGNRMVFDATLMNFIVLGEMAARISDGLKAQWPVLPWSDVKDFRNLVAHEYLGIDAEEVWQIIKQDIPELKQGIAKVLSDFEQEDELDR